MKRRELSVSKLHQSSSNPITYQAPLLRLTHQEPPLAPLDPSMCPSAPRPLPPPPPPQPIHPRSRKEILRMIGMDCSDDSSDELQPQHDSMEDEQLSIPPPPPPLSTIHANGDWGRPPRATEVGSFGADVSNMHPRPPPPLPKPFKVPSLSLHKPITISSNTQHALTAPTHPHNDTRSYLDISLPQPCLDLSTKSQPERKVSIPTSFTSITQYVDAIIRALIEEVDLKLAQESCSHFHYLLAHIINRRQQQLLQGGNLVVPASGPLAHSIAEEIQASCMGQRVPYFASCELRVWRESKTSNPKFKGKRKAADEEQGEEEERKGGGESISLAIPGLRQRIKGSRMGDLWLVSSHPFLTKQESSSSWSALVRSKWHGPNNDGKFEVEFVTCPPSRLARSQNVYCLKGPDAHSEIQILRLLRDLQQPKAQESQAPLLPHLISSPALRSLILAQDAPRCSIVQRLVLNLNLNDDQAAVMTQVASWVQYELSGQRSDSPPELPVCLVHGPFGSGKSSLLIAVILLIDQLNESKKNFRVLISAHTNIAVDRILTGLMAQGFTSFMRLGSLKKINKSILQHSVHSSCSSDSLSELKEMLRDAGNEKDKNIIQAEIDAFSKGEERKRKKALMTLPVIGATCCALLEPSCPLFADPQPPNTSSSFQLLILDECSQMTEPLSLAPILRSKAKYLLACGDPCQLPPVLVSPSQLTSVNSSLPPDSFCGLARPMFVRMRQLGHPSVLLRTQYRLHPDLSFIPNKHFYNSRLIDGVSPEDRESIIGPVFPTLSFCSIKQGGCQVDARTKSSFSRPEASLIANLVNDISLKIDLNKCSLGVICFYNAQVEAIRKEIDRVMLSLDQGGSTTEAKFQIQVSSVDSFQGQEKEIIILATTIDKSSSFVSDPCRLNVALTRAKRHLVVVGVSEALRQTSPVFDEIIKRATRLTKDHVQ